MRLLSLGFARRTVYEASVRDFTPRRQRGELRQSVFVSHTYRWVNVPPLFAHTQRVRGPQVRCFFLRRSSPCTAGTRKRFAVGVPVFLRASFAPVVLSESGADGKMGQDFVRHLLDEKSFYVLMCYVKSNLMIVTVGENHSQVFRGTWTTCCRVTRAHVSRRIMVSA